MVLENTPVAISEIHALDYPETDLVDACRSPIHIQEQSTPGDHDVGEDPRVAPITARHVMSHRTGFLNWRVPSAPQTINFVLGERFSYFGEGFVFLARAVERQTGESTGLTVKRLCV